MAIYTRNPTVLVCTPNPEVDPIFLPFSASRAQTPNRHHMLDRGDYFSANDVAVPYVLVFVLPLYLEEDCGVRFCLVS
jgi:hypothetical protein